MAAVLEPERHCLAPEELAAIERAWSRPVTNPYSSGYVGGHQSRARRVGQKERAWRIPEVKGRP